QKLWITTRNLLPPLFMIFAVLGSILLGWASPTEAAAIGALSSVVLTALYGRFSLAGTYEALIKTVKITAMIMTVLLAGTMFTGVFIGGGGISTANILIGKAHLSPWMLLSLMMSIIFIAGFFLDWISIVLIFVPLFTPLIVAAGFDSVWFLVLFLIMIQTSYLTPPMAPAIFYLRAVAPEEISIRHMYRGVAPFIALQCVVLVIVMIFPVIVTYLPSVMLNFR
ncbi:MAG: TRAP transporter large permease subunit, partial [Burkholderiales bacterium]|nr:TRAP transporter large permease subunit [Burkholderiales bacterium]